MDAGGGDCGSSYTYDWEYTTDGSNWNTTGTSGTTYQPPALSQTTTYRRKVTCSAEAGYSNEITITVLTSSGGGTVLWGDILGKPSGFADDTDNVDDADADPTNEIQTITLTGDVSGSGTGTFSTSLSNTGISPGSYTNANITVDSKGRITAASNGNGTSSGGIDWTIDQGSTNIHTNNYIESDPTVPNYTKNLNSATKLLDELKTVDGGSSGLNAQYVNGISSYRMIYGGGSGGTTQITSDLNNITKSGFYYAWDGSTNKPGTTNGYLIHTQYSGSNLYSMQLFTPYTGDQLYLRRKDNGTWQNWIQVSGGSSGSYTPGNGINIINNEISLDFNGLSNDASPLTTDYVMFYDYSSARWERTRIENIAGGGISDGNNYPTSLNFDSSTGVLTLGRNSLSSLTVDMDGRYFQGTSISLNNLSNVNATSPAPNQVLKWTGSVWAPGNDETGGTGSSLWNTTTGNNIAYTLGNVSIGSNTTSQNLHVFGKIYSTEVLVQTNVPTPDYVFEKDYNLKPLSEVESFISQNKHLPEIPTAKEVDKNGIDLGKMNMLLLKKVEELTLYILQQEKRIKKLEEKMDK